MKILLTGVKGFIGHHLYSYLKEHIDGVEIIGVDNCSGLGTGERDVPYIHADLNDIILPDVDVVIHLAAKAGVRESIKYPKTYWDSNVLTTNRIFEFYSGKAKILYASSSSVYDMLSPYAMTKAVCDLIAPADAIGMRFYTVYGPNGRPDMLIRMLKENKISYITNHKRDFTHVYDIVSAIVTLLGARGGMYDIGYGESVDVSRVAELMGKG